ncbi:hypothetical protein [Amycolatopsis jiangsuensis]|uniref:Chlorite dismutase n=1 Tax=Amycolatopsis jiangsuensis TaxID=1181879 RepID=A0A840IMQ1_9PSEU|nr:hypothetical protein [Amycolatopsis jiangsuensis]MBB4683163.1 hypothetical protein [Amycolatopsis jiangsuensis]
MTRRTSTTALSPGRERAARRNVGETVEQFRREGWHLSVASMFDGVSRDAEMYQTGFAHHVDFVTAWEAPDPFSAASAVDRLRDAGWELLHESSWLIGPREFRPVPGAGRDPAGGDWAMFAFWEWNDHWQAATPREVVEYDAECDVAFQADVDAGIGIAGRYRMDAGSQWHHLAVWELPGVRTLTSAMAEHERVADFKFTTSRHYLGRRAPLSSILGDE